MSSAVIRAGAIGGVLGGIVMAMWSMIAFAASDMGFWTPLNLIAHTVWREAPLGGTFSAVAVVIGVVIHMMMSMLFGTAIAFVGMRLPRHMVAMAGAGLGLLIWFVVGSMVWRLVDPVAASSFEPWVFASAHLMYGGVTAGYIAAVAPAEATAADPSTQH